MLTGIDGRVPHVTGRHARDCRTVSRSARLAAVFAVVALMVWPGASAAQAQPVQGGTPEPTPATPEAPPVPDPRVSPLLLAVPVDSPAYRAAIDRYRGAEARLAEARTSFADNQSRLGELHAAEARLVGTTNEAARKRDKADRRIVELRANVREFAIASYMGGGIGDPVIPSLDLDEANEQARQRALTDTVSEQVFAELTATLDERARMDALLARATEELVDVRDRLVATTQARDDAIANGAQAARDLERFGRDVADARLEAQVVGLDFSFVVLDAYVKAAFTLAGERPACGLRWTALAGIGRTESGHGTFGGATVRADGSVTRPIIGIPLDGTNNTAVIGDSAGGALDGDPSIDRAVGPMQFIPTSWRTLGRDGNGDGDADPQNMYDAALAAANLLCRSQGLDTDAGMRAAFLRYNNSSAYASLVLERTHRYDQFVIPPVP